MKSQCWVPLGLTGWISLQSKGLSGVFSCTTIQKHQFFGTHYILKHQFFGAVFIMVQYSHPWMTTGKTITLTIGNFVSKMMSLLLICCLSWFSFQGASIFWFHGCCHHWQWIWSPRKENISVFIIFPLLFVMNWWDWLDDMIFMFFEFEFQTSFLPSSRGSLVPLHFLSLE